MLEQAECVAIRSGGMLLAAYFLETHGAGDIAATVRAVRSAVVIRPRSGDLTRT